MIDPPKDLMDLADQFARQIVALQAAEASQAAQEQTFPSKKRTKVSEVQDNTRLRTWQGALALLLTGNQYEFDRADDFVESYRMKVRAQRESR